MRATVLLLLGACAAPQAEPEPVETPAPREERPAMNMVAQVGALDPYATDETFKRLEPAVSRCLRAGTAQVEGLGGEFTVSLRIRPDGSVEDAFMAASTLGSREAERCILEAARAKTWPLPLGGTAEAEHTFAVDSPVEVDEREPDRLRTVMPAIRRELARCLPRRGGVFQATIYLHRDGRVLSAGVAPPNAESDDKCDCVAEVLRSFRLGRQRHELTKITFTFR